MTQPNQPPKYRYVDEFPDGNIPVEIMDGQYEGIMVRYGKVVLEEKNDELVFDYDYEIVQNPDNIEMSEDLRDQFTAILVSVLDEQITNMPDDFDLLKEGDSEEHRESNTPKPHIQ